MGSLNNSKWEQIFKEYRVLEQIKEDKVFQISAKIISRFREPRLMAKFDHENNLPDIFRENNLAILPISRGDYIVSKFSAYHKFEKTENAVKYFSMPDRLESLSQNNIKSETIAINCAAASGILADFLQEEWIVPTVSGRMGSGHFQFMIDNHSGKSKYFVNVNDSQIEIDAAYEGQNFLALLEAKRDLSDDFLVRQLYYPYRTWEQKIKKKIRPVFLIYSNGIYQLYEYRFSDKKRYNSIELVQSKSYSIEENKITYSDIDKILRLGIFEEEPNDIPFPQADDFSRIINLCELLNEQALNKEEITLQYDFTSRQTDYYINAARYLGLVELYHSACRLSAMGEKFFTLKFKERQLAFCKAILAHKVFYHCFQIYREQHNVIGREEVISVMKAMCLNRLNSEDTYSRRSQTIISWIKWIERLYHS